jgi:hypothetical protein
MEAMMGRMKDKYTDWDGDDEPNMLGKKGKKSRGKKDKNYDDWKREVPSLLRRLRHNQKLAELISQGY